MLHPRNLIVSAVLAAAAIQVAGAAGAADRAGFIAHCEKSSGADAKAKCGCMAGKIDAAFKDKALAYAYLSVSASAGDVANFESGMTAKEEDEIVDKTFQFMKECGLAK
jgi:hypothetical protein